MVGGDEEVSRFRDPAVNEDYDVQLRLAEGDRNDPGTIARLYVPRQTAAGSCGSTTSCRSCRRRRASRIDRLDRQRAGQPARRGRARLRAWPTASRRCASAAAEMNLPPAYTTAVSGRGRELERTFAEFLWAFLLSVIFMYMILASQFESLVHPLTILLSLPLSVPVRAALALADRQHAEPVLGARHPRALRRGEEELDPADRPHEQAARRRAWSALPAILQANRDRLRPILMTTLALVAGMLPLALGTGPGAEERRTIAVVVIGGQTLSLLLTLLVTPVAYSLFDDLARMLGWQSLVRISRRGLRAARARR